MKVCARPPECGELLERDGPAAESGPHRNLPLVEPYTGRTVGIDVEMVPIISTLWSLGFRTVGCCQGYPDRAFPAARDGAFPAVICFEVVGRVDRWGLLRSRYRKGRQYATRLAVMLAGVAPDDRWRTWRWDLDTSNRASALVLPNEDLPWLVAVLERIERAATGQLALDALEGWRPTCASSGWGRHSGALRYGGP